MTAEQIIKNNAYENELLELIEQRDELTQSDIQGRVSVIVKKIQNEGLV